MTAPFSSVLLDGSCVLSLPVLFLDQISQKAESGGRPALLEPLDLLEQLGEHYKPTTEIRSLFRFKIDFSVLMQTIKIMLAAFQDYLLRWWHVCCL